MKSVISLGVQQLKGFFGDRLQGLPMPEVFISVKVSQAAAESKAQKKREEERKVGKC